MLTTRNGSTLSDTVRRDKDFHDDGRRRRPDVSAVRNTIEYDAVVLDHQCR